MADLLWLMIDLLIQLIVFAVDVAGIVPPVREKRVFRNDSCNKR